jgi:Methyltransferase FkbM domain
MNRRPLDGIMADYPFAMNANILKIDTDGHDLDVLAGAKNLIARNLPAIIFECEPWDSQYIDACLRTLRLLKESGYACFLLYSNYGELLGRYSLSDLSSFRHQLMLQQSYYYHDYDILLMRDDDVHAFYEAEGEYFEGKLETNRLGRS